MNNNRFMQIIAVVALLLSSWFGYSVIQKMEHAIQAMEGVQIKVTQVVTVAETPDVGTPQKGANPNE